MHSDIVTALRCGSTIGSWCFKECKYRENDRCELCERTIRQGAADLIESQKKQITELQAKIEELYKINAGLRDSSGKYSF